MSVLFGGDAYEMVGDGIRTELDSRRCYEVNRNNNVLYLYRSRKIHAKYIKSM